MASFCFCFYLFIKVLRFAFIYIHFSFQLLLVSCPGVSLSSLILLLYTRRAAIHLPSIPIISHPPSNKQKPKSQKVSIDDIQPLRLHLCISASSAGSFRSPQSWAVPSFSSLDFPFWALRNLKRLNSPRENRLEKALFAPEHSYRFPQFISRLVHHQKHISKLLAFTFSLISPPHRQAASTWAVRFSSRLYLLPCTTRRVHLI